MAHYYRNLGEVGERFLEIVGEALCGGAYGIDVHAVGSGAHNAAEAAGAEFEVAVESFYKCCGIGIVEHALHFGAGFFVIGLTEPNLGFGGDVFQQFVVFFHII